MNSPVPFWKAFLGTCAGRQIFYSLRFNSWGRVIWHLFLLSFITGVITGNVQNSRLTDYVEASRIAFSDTFGKEICIDQKRTPWNWVCPAEDPAKPRELALPGGGRFFYTGLSRQVPASLKTTSGTIIVWTPTRFAMAVPDKNGTFDCASIDEKGRISRSSGTLDRVEKFFSAVPEKLPGSVEKMNRESVKTVFENVSALLNFCLVTGAFFRNFMLVWLYTGIFMGMYRLLNGPSGRLSFLTLKEMWKCGIYASFPPMVIASLFPILELPFVTYETVFMIGLLIYWMAVTAKLERTPVETEENTDR